MNESGEHLSLYDIVDGTHGWRGTGVLKVTNATTTGSTNRGLGISHWRLLR